MQKLPGNLKRIIPMLVAVLYMVTFYMLFQSGNEVLLWTGVVLMGLCAGLGGGGLRPLAPTIMFQSAMAATMGMSVLQFSQCIGNCFSPVYGMLLDGGMSYLEASLVTMHPAFDRHAGVRVLHPTEGRQAQPAAEHQAVGETSSYAPFAEKRGA